MIEKIAVSTGDAPAAIGPYNQAIRAGGLVFASGQIGLEPGGDAVAGADAEAQTGQALANLAAILRAAGASLDHVVKTTVYLADMADFPAMNRVYAEHFSGVAPARATVAVKALPMGARVEIDAIAVAGPAESRPASAPPGNG